MIYLITAIVITMIINSFTSYKNTQDTKLKSSADIPGVSATPSHSPIESQKPTSTPAPTSQPTDHSSSLDQFIYPGSKVSQKTQNSLDLESSDNTDKITDWYKNKIKSLNLNTQTFVVTNSNDNVLNKLISAGSEKRINVEIKKEPGSNKTQISVSLAGF